MAAVSNASLRTGAVLTDGSVFVGCAGWKLSREFWPGFDDEGTHLEKYASRLTAVEINSSFYRAHRPATYARWASSVSGEFRFSVKMPKSIIHENRLQHCEPLLDLFLAQCGELGSSLGCLLIQLPPSLSYEPKIADDFLAAIRARYSGYLVIEPRHESWVNAQALLIDHQVAQAGVDPSRISNDSVPNGWAGLRYWRLHGSPKIYYSAYQQDWLEQLALTVQSETENGIPTWCIFDNTARDAALGNALDFTRLLAQSR